MLLSLCEGFSLLLLVHNGVPPKHGIRFVARDFHCYGLGNTGGDHVAGSSAAKIMEDAPHILQFLTSPKSIAILAMLLHDSSSRVVFMFVDGEKNKRYLLLGGADTPYGVPLSELAEQDTLDDSAFALLQSRNFVDTWLAELRGYALDKKDVTAGMLALQVLVDRVDLDKNYERQMPLQDMLPGETVAELQTGFGTVMLQGTEDTCTERGLCDGKGSATHIYKVNDPPQIRSLVLIEPLRQSIKQYIQVSGFKRVPANSELTPAGKDILERVKSVQNFYAKQAMSQEQLLKDMGAKEGPFATTVSQIDPHLNNDPTTSVLMTGWQAA